MGGCFGRTNLIPARTHREPERWDWVLSQRFRHGFRPQTSLWSRSSRRGIAGAFRLGPRRVSPPTRHLWLDARWRWGLPALMGFGPSPGGHQGTTRWARHTSRTRPKKKEGPKIRWQRIIIRKHHENITTSENQSLIHISEPTRPY